MASNTGHVMNLANSIIGVSLLAMPFCFKQCGITLAILMLVLSSIVSKLACHFLVKSSTMCRRRNFEFLAFYTFGPSGKLLVELGVIGFMMGTCVAFFVVMGDLGPAIISKIFNVSNNNTLRTSVLTGLGVLVVLPLGLLRNVESLAAISTVTIAYYFLFILKVFLESFSHLVSGEWWSHVKFWQPEGILQCTPIFAMALSCQTQLFEIYNSLPSPSIEKMNSVVRSALNLCTVVYASVGLLGYIAYCKENFTGNIMMSFTPSLSSEIFKLGFVMSTAVSFPLVIFPCRASLFSLIFKRMPIHQELSQTSSHIPDSRYKCLTVVIVSVALATGLLIPSIELVLGFVGSTIGIAICVIFPSLSFLNLYNKNTNERVMAKVTLMLGLLIMIMGTFGNLFAAVEHRPMYAPPEDSRDFLQVKVPPKVAPSTESAKRESSNNNYGYKKGVALVNPLPPEKLISQKPEKGPKPRVKIVENIRKEPPVPVAPPANDQPKESQKPKEEKPKSQLEIIEKRKPVDEAKRQKPVINVKQNENIDKDAIEKEEREIMEIEKQRKTEEDEKQQAFLKKLKEHQDEQKKLLLEQEKILKEMKNRESEKKSKEEKKSEILLKEVKTIKPEEFKANLNKIQSVIETLKETKNMLDKVKVDAEKGRDGGGFAGGVGRKEEFPEMKNASSGPLPAAKLPPAQPAEEAEPGKQKPRVVAAAEREKRDAEQDGEGGECDSSRGEQRERLPGEKGKQKTEDEVEGAREPTGGPAAPLIKSSSHLTAQVGGGAKEGVGDKGTAKLLPFISKKRDLKSVPTTAE